MSRGIVLTPLLGIISMIPKENNIYSVFLGIIFLLLLYLESFESEFNAKNIVPRKLFCVYLLEASLNSSIEQTQMDGSLPPLWEGIGPRSSTECASTLVLVMYSF